MKVPNESLIRFFFFSVINFASSFVFISIMYGAR